MTGTGRTPAWVDLRWEGGDRHRWLTVLAAVGTLAGVLLAWRGLPPVDLHTPLHHAGVMDPLCGGTRSLRHVFRGELLLAWRYNPLGPVLVAAAVAAWLRAIVGTVAGRWLTVRVRRTRPLVVAVLAALVALEANQQLHADLLTTVGG